MCTFYVIVLCTEFCYLHSKIYLWKLISKTHLVYAINNVYPLKLKLYDSITLLFTFV